MTATHFETTVSEEWYWVVASVAQLKRYEHQIKVGRVPAIVKLKCGHSFSNDLRLLFLNQDEEYEGSTMHRAYVRLGRSLSLAACHQSPTHKSGKRKESDTIIPQKSRRWGWRAYIPSTFREENVRIGSRRRMNE
ncbi:hypothetical protein C8J57DRAFT_1240197 [Mycena rebaudengoi]|nr:hypothetical protein C8J57DRAFT_1240197 [Mycena rebaudengoi]